MLRSEPTKYGSGILLCGDPIDLECLRGTVHTLVRRPHLDGILGEYVLSLAYDVRKAYEGCRDRVKVASDTGSRVTYLGVKIPWPSFLMFLALLRWAAGFDSLSKSERSVLLRLEFCAEDALERFDRIIGTKAVRWLNRFTGVGEDYLPEVIFHADVSYLSSRSAGIRRFKLLPDSLMLMTPGSPQYRGFREMMCRRAKELNCKPLDLHYYEDYPGFKW